jgi:omega-hydroxy-beta-dihydromenaquinone-9 sulfotransferase
MNQSKRVHEVSLVHPIMMGSLRASLRQLWRNGGFDRRYLSTVVTSLFGSALLKPLRGVEAWRFGRKIAATNLPPAPVFIIGHARSGTTLLHELLATDRRFAYVSTLHAMMPHTFLTVSRSRAMSSLFAKLLPATRPMDNMLMGPELPQEEEYALSALTHASYCGEYFLRTASADFDRYVLFAEIAPAEREAWKTAYLRVLKQVAYAMQGRTLLLKNPYNTARIATLLEMFPDARFIHIYRNPYVVYPSFVHTIRKLSEELGLQDISEDALHEHAFRVYEKTMRKFWETRDLIPADNLVEVRYETLELNPLQELERIYSRLRLGDFQHARPGIDTYLASRHGYRKNRYEVDAALARRIGERCGWIVDKLLYGAPELARGSSSPVAV